VKYLLIILILSVISNCTSEKAPAYSAELQKVILYNHYFPGDKVLTPSGESAIIVQADSSVAKVWLPSQQNIREFIATDLVKSHSLRLFRGAEPGIPLRWVSLTEPALPRFKDSLGLSYYYTLGEDKFFRVDYYCQPGSNPALIESIYLEVSYSLEADAIRLYRELSEWIESEQGAPVGQLGDFYWNITNKPLRMHLALSGQKKNITLSIEPRPRKITES
jgi:hypothetical protein